MRVLALWVPNLSLQHFLREHPGRRGRPLVLFASKGPREEVVQASVEAVHLGIVPGMTLVQARSRSEELVEAPFKQNANGRVMEEVVEALGVLSPTIALEPPDGFYCDVRGSERVLRERGGALGVGREVLVSLDLVGRGCVASTLSTAWALSCFGPRDWFECPEEETLGAIAALPIASLCPAGEVDTFLRSLGVCTVAQLRTSPKEALVRRFGQDGAVLYERAYGRDCRVLEPFRASPPLVSAQELPDATSSLETLSFSLKALLDPLQARMRGRGEAALRLRVQLETERGSWEDEIALPRPQHSTPVLLAIVKERLSRLRLEAPVSRVEIRVVEVTGSRAEQPDLLAMSVQSLESLDELLSRLMATLGEAAVYSPRPASEHRPECGVERVGFDPPARPDSLLPMPVEDRRIRPVSLLEEPEAIGWLAGPTRRLQRESGGVWEVWTLEPPERLSGGWWKHRYVRDYYRVWLVGGASWWIYRELRGGDWFLHGLFD